MKRKAFYSVIQYCPDMARMECANVGVVLFIPDDGFLGAKIDQGFVRVRKFFPDANITNLNIAIQAFTNGLHAFEPTKENLQGWIDTRANTLRMTPLRAMTMNDSPDAEVGCLFQVLVEETHAPVSGN